MTDVARFVIGTLAVVAFVLAIALAQGIGEAFGNGVIERLVP